MRHSVKAAVVVAALLGGSAGPLIGGSAVAAPSGGPIAQQCSWDGGTISAYNSTKEPAGPKSTTGSVIATECTPGASNPRRTSGSAARHQPRPVVVGDRGVSTNVAQLRTCASRST